jgi:hypothetical protein
MTKQCVRWKPFRAKTIRNTAYDSCFGDLIDLYNKGTLVSQILKMDRKRPLEFAQAALLAHDKYVEAMMSRKLGGGLTESTWYLNHFVSWISELGYHIELTGDEFESNCLSAKII